MHVSTPIFPNETLIHDDGTMQIYIPDAPAKPVTLPPFGYRNRVIHDADILPDLPAWMIGGRV